MNYDELPAKVKESTPSPDENPDIWQLRHLDAGDIHAVECAVCDADLFHLPHEDGSCWHCGAEACYVNEFGEMAHGEHVGDPATAELGYNMALETDDDASAVMCGHCQERHGEGNTIIVIGPEGRTWGASYEDSVIRDASPYGEGKHEALYDAPDWAWSLLRSLVTGTGWHNTDGWRGHTATPAAAEGGDVSLTKVSGGWHSSMEKSDLSERINTLTSGDFHGRDGLDCPVAVQFGRTSNVFSIGIDVYAPEGHTDSVEEILDASAAPGHAGVR